MGRASSEAPQPGASSKTFPPGRSVLGPRRLLLLAAPQQSVSRQLAFALDGQHAGTFEVEQVADPLVRGRIDQDRARCGFGGDTARDVDCVTPYIVDEPFYSDDPGN